MSLTTTEPIVTLTEAAAGRIKELLSEHQAEGDALRIFIQESHGRPTHGMAIEDSIEDDDTVYEQHGVRVVVDPASLPLLQGATFDFKTDVLQSGFAVMNPNLRGGCGGGGCGSGCSCG